MATTEDAAHEVEGDNDDLGWVHVQLDKVMRNSRNIFEFVDKDDLSMSGEGILSSLSLIGLDGEICIVLLEVHLPYLMPFSH